MGWIPEPKHLQAIEAAIALAEVAAAQARAVDANVALVTANDALQASLHAVSGFRENAAHVAGHAAVAAHSASLACGDISAASDELGVTRDSKDPIHVAANRYDYELLSKAADCEGWDDSTPVPPEFFGPLWPFDKPDDWPEEAVSEPQDPELSLELDVPDDATDEQIAELVQQAMSRANAVLIGTGGAGLTLDEGSVQVWTPVREGIPS